jgi:hypothetical protein
MVLLKCCKCSKLLMCMCEEQVRPVLYGGDGGEKRRGGWCRLPGGCGDPCRGWESPPPLMEGRWNAKEFVVILSRILCMLAGGHCKGSVSLGKCGEILARLNPGRRACEFKCVASKGRALTMGVGPGCTRCEYPWLYPYLWRVRDKEEYDLSSRGWACLRLSVSRGL